MLTTVDRRGPQQLTRHCHPRTRLRLLPAAGLAGIHGSGIQAPHLQVGCVSGGGADSAEANFGNGLLPGGGEDGGGGPGTTSGQGSLEPGILVDNHAAHFAGAAAASPSLFTGRFLRPRSAADCLTDVIACSSCSS